jgi:hypothetical protein
MARNSASPSMPVWPCVDHEIGSASDLGKRGAPRQSVAYRLAGSVGCVQVPVARAFAVTAATAKSRVREIGRHALSLAAAPREPPRAQPNTPVETCLEEVLRRANETGRVSIS